MQNLHSLDSQDFLHSLCQEEIELIVLCIDTHRVTQILEVKYEKANLTEVINNNCKEHLESEQLTKSFQFLIQYEELFKYTLDNCQEEDVESEQLRGCMVIKIVDN